MRYIVFHLDAGFAGMDSTEFEAYEDISDTELDDEAWYRALAHAEMYGIYPESERPDEEDEDDGDWRSDGYTDNIEGYWEEYDPEKHDGLVSGGGVPFPEYPR